jgi:hypothetical protein
MGKDDNLRSLKVIFIKNVILTKNGEKDIVIPEGTKGEVASRCSSIMFDPVAIYLDPKGHFHPGVIIKIINPDPKWDWLWEGVAIPLDAIKAVK